MLALRLTQKLLTDMKVAPTELNDVNSLFSLNQGKPLSGKRLIKVC